MEKNSFLLRPRIVNLKKISIVEDAFLHNQEKKHIEKSSIWFYSQHITIVYKDIYIPEGKEDQLREYLENIKHSTLAHLGIYYNTVDIVIENNDIKKAILDTSEFFMYMSMPEKREIYNIWKDNILIEIKRHKKMSIKEKTASLNEFKSKNKLELLIKLDNIISRWIENQGMSKIEKKYLKRKGPIYLYQEINYNIIEINEKGKKENEETCKELIKREWRILKNLLNAFGDLNVEILYINNIIYNKNRDIDKISLAEKIRKNNIKKYNINAHFIGLHNISPSVVFLLFKMYRFSYLSIIYIQLHKKYLENFNEVLTSIGTEKKNNDTEACLIFGRFSDIFSIYNSFLIYEMLCDFENNLKYSIGLYVDKYLDKQELYYAFELSTKFNIYLSCMVWSEFLDYLKESSLHPNIKFMPVFLINDSMLEDIKKLKTCFLEKQTYIKNIKKISFKQKNYLIYNSEEIIEIVKTVLECFPNVKSIKINKIIINTKCYIEEISNTPFSSVSLEAKVNSYYYKTINENRKKLFTDLNNKQTSKNIQCLNENEQISNIIIFIKKKTLLSIKEMILNENDTKKSLKSENNIKETNVDAKLNYISESCIKVAKEFIENIEDGCIICANTYDNMNNYEVLCILPCCKNILCDKCFYKISEKYYIKTGPNDTYIFFFTFKCPFCREAIDLCKKGMIIYVSQTQELKSNKTTFKYLRDSFYYIDITKINIKLNLKF